MERVVKERRSDATDPPKHPNLDPPHRLLELHRRPAALEHALPPLVEERFFGGEPEGGGEGWGAEGDEEATADWPERK